MRLDVKLLGDPILRTPAQDVETLTPELRKLIADMFDTMYAEDGVGLAAPQVGISQRIIVVDPHEEGVDSFALINPVVIETSRDVERGEEGCLSIPGLKDVVERPYSAIVEGQTPEGETRRIDKSALNVCSTLT